MHHTIGAERRQATSRLPLPSPFSPPLPTCQWHRRTKRTLLKIPTHTARSTPHPAVPKTCATETHNQEVRTDIYKKKKVPFLPRPPVVLPPNTDGTASMFVVHVPPSAVRGNKRGSRVAFSATFSAAFTGSGTSTGAVLQEGRL